MQSAYSIAERRFYPRHRVRVTVLWRDRRQEAMRGEICDISAHGLFLVSTSAVPDEIAVGDRTEVILRTKTGELTLVGNVRWRGFHPLHQAIGCGIQLDDPSAEVVAKLFPVVQQPGPPPQLSATQVLPG